MARLEDEFLHLCGALQGYVEDVLHDGDQCFLLALRHLVLVEGQEERRVEAAHLKVFELLCARAQLAAGEVRCV